MSAFFDEEGIGDGAGEVGGGHQAWHHDEHWHLSADVLMGSSSELCVKMTLGDVLLSLSDDVLLVLGLVVAVEESGYQMVRLKQREQKEVGDGEGKGERTCKRGRQLLERERAR